MKLVYFLKDDKKDKNCIGIYNKIEGQLKAFLHYKIEPSLIFLEGNNLVLKDIKNDAEKKIFSFQNKFQKKILIYKILLNQILNIKPEYLYIRYPMSDMFFLNFLKKVKKKLNNTRTAIEFPTYPYDQEAKDILTRFLIILDKIYRNKISKYVDFAVTYTDFKKIYNIDSVFIENGINLANIKLSKKENVENEIVLIGVANVSFWHGFDRVIEGLKKYYNSDIQPKYKIVFNIVGEGLEINNLKKQVALSNLEEKVIFSGYKTGKELDSMFDCADFGVGSLGAHRKNIFLESALKSREYCARGIPFIISSDDKDFFDFKYTLKVEKDNDFVDMNFIIKFFEEIRSNNLGYKLVMRKFAENNLSWDVKMKKVVEKFKNKEDKS